MNVLRGLPKPIRATTSMFGAPIPGIITEVAVGIGTKVAKGDKLLTMEAMKMQTTVYAAADGVVDKINVGIGESVSKDLIMELREA